MTVLWATTFSKDLWEESGRLLIESFVATKTPGLLAAYIEGMDLPEAYPNVVQRRIDDDPVIATFRRKHNTVIPVALGGGLVAPECRCNKKPLDIHSRKHRLPCPGYWFCKNAFRWFRKPLSAVRACDEFGTDHDVMMWVDADASFLQTVPAETVESWFKDKAACIYLKSRREAIETGVFGYHLRRGGLTAAHAVLARYTSGVFRKDKRWDDCVQMERGLADCKVPTADLATNVGPRNTVIQFSPLAKYLGHDKGRHLRTKRLA